MQRRTWPALILAPLLALAATVLGYAAVGRACERDMIWLVHAAMLIPLVISLGATASAYTVLRASHIKEFLPLVATWTGAFFSLVIVAQWSAMLFLNPCMH
jgi:hypothetical protein